MLDKEVEGTTQNWTVSETKKWTASELNHLKRIYDRDQHMYSLMTTETMNWWWVGAAPGVKPDVAEDGVA